MSLAAGRCAGYLSVLARHGMWSWLRSTFPVCVTRHEREGAFLPGTFSLKMLLPAGVTTVGFCLLGHASHVGKQPLMGKAS